MAEITTSPIATSAGHWYDRQGNMVETVPGASGKPVAPDIRHARKLGLLPGVTSVCKVLASPGLTNWLVDQALMSALTLPRIEGESLDAFKDRAREDSKEQSEKAAERGTALHTALELAFQERSFNPEYLDHVRAVDDKLKSVGVDLFKGESEKSFASQLGHGGKCDWHSREQRVLLDYKSKQSIENPKKLAYDEHIMQGAALADGLLMPPDTRILNVFVGIEDRKVVVVEWEAGEISRGREMFRAALRLWQLRNRYDSSFTATQAAA